MLLVQPPSPNTIQGKVTQGETGNFRWVRALRDTLLALPLLLVWWLLYRSSPDPP